jgi:hypothetical protein
MRWYLLRDCKSRHAKDIRKQNYSVFPEVFADIFVLLVDISSYFLNPVRALPVNAVFPSFSVLCEDLYFSGDDYEK